MTEDMPPDPDERGSNEYAVWLEEIAAAVDEDAVFAVLAGKRPPRSKLARQQMRGRLVSTLQRKFDRLGCNASPAKTADAWLQEGGHEDGEDDLQGERFVAEETEPWGDSVDGGDLLNEVAAVFDAYLHAPAHILDAISLWCVYTHVYHLFGVSPIFDFSSPTKRCGKSTGVIVARYLVHAPLLSGNITPSSIFRSIDAWKPTLLIDEADSFLAMSEELRGLLNAGHTKDTAFSVRTEGDTREPRRFSTWAPKLVAAIGRLPDTVEDRSIRAPLSRKPANVVKLDAFDGPAVYAVCLPVRQRIVRWTLDNLDEIAAAAPERPAGLHDRQWNNWKPLFAIAAVAGNGWLQRAASSALTLGNDEDAEEDVHTLTLQLVWKYLSTPDEKTRKPVERATTLAVLQYLIGQDEGPFARWWEWDVADLRTKGPAAKLSKLLKQFKLKPKKLRFGEETLQGYDIEDFRTPGIQAFLSEDGTLGTDGTAASQSQADVPFVPSVPTSDGHAAKDAFDRDVADAVFDRLRNQHEGAE